MQIACLALFILLFVNTRFREHVEPDASAHVFFHLDPLILAGTFLASYAVPAAALLALVTLAATLLFGRIFCGWICPLGTINHFVGWLRNRVRGLPDASPRSG